MLRQLPLIFACCLGHSMAAQDVAAFIDPYNNFMLFDHGVFSKLEGQRPEQFAVGGNNVAYIAYNGDLRVHANGTTTTLDRTDGMRPVVTDNLIAFVNAGTLKVWDGRQMNSVCYNTDSFLAEDSLVAFFDGARSLLNVYYDGQVILLEDALANWPVANWKAGDNVLAWVTTVEKKFKVLYRGGIYELNDLVQDMDYQVGRDIVAYQDASDKGFKVFNAGELHDVEPFMPKSYQCGAGLVAYVDQNDELKVFQKGKVYSMMDFAPKEYFARDSLVVARDGNQMLVFQNGATHRVLQYWPTSWSVSWSTLAYADNNGNVAAWHDGKSAIVIHGGPFEQMQLLRGLVLATRGSTTRVWWKNEVFSY